MSASISESKEPTAITPDHASQGRTSDYPQPLATLLAKAQPVALTGERLLATQAMRLLMRLDRELLEARAQWNQDWFRRIMHARSNPDTGTRYTDIKKSFSAACREAGITNFTFHDLRHTFGTRLADAGVDVVKIKELMGHASIVT